MIDIKLPKNENVKTAGGYWVPAIDINNYANEFEAKQALIELFKQNNFNFCYSINELISFLKEKTGYDYSSIDKKKVIPKQSQVLDGIINSIIYSIDFIDKQINKTQCQGVFYYYAPKIKASDYLKDINIKRSPRKMGLPNHTYFYEGNRNFVSSSKLLKDKPCGIYMITNLITNEKYIGQATDIQSRWEGHIFATDNTRLHKDMRELGLNNFAFTILKHDNPFTLDIDEVNLIAKYDTFNNGYNSTPGNIKKAKLQQDFLSKNKIKRS